MQRAFLYNLYEHNVKFPFAALFGGRNYRDKFNFFSVSELGYSPQGSVGKFTYICHFKGVKITAIARDVFVALAVVVTKAPYIHESDSSVLVLLQTRMSICGKVSG